MNEPTIYEPQLAIRDGHAVTSSRHVAESFGKQHDNVLLAIRRAECSAEFRRLNFKAATYRDAQGKPRPAIEMTRDGFCFIAMGFTGAKAAHWKEAYIHAFNIMEARLQPPPEPAPVTVPATDLMAAQTRELELSRKLIEAQEKLLAATGKKPKRKAVRPITSDEIAEMKHLRALGLPVAEIARRTGRNSGSISQLTRDVADTADLFAGAS